MELQMKREESETNFGSELDLNQISELAKHNAEQMKSLIEQLMGSTDDSMLDILQTLSQILQQY